MRARCQRPAGQNQRTTAGHGRFVPDRWHGGWVSRCWIGLAVIAILGAAASCQGTLQAEPSDKAASATPQEQKVANPSADAATEKSKPASEAPVRRGPVRPWVRLSRETTFFTEPLDEDGYVDYAAALDRIMGQGIPPEKNACPLLLRAIGPRLDGRERVPNEVYRRLGMNPLPDQGEYFVPIFNYLRDVAGLQTRAELRRAFEEYQFACRHPWKPQNFPHLAAWLKANEKPLALIAEAVKRPYFYWPLVRPEGVKESPRLEDIIYSGETGLREAAEALQIRSMLRISQGEQDGAWEDLLTALRLARHMGHYTVLRYGSSISTERRVLECLPVFIQHAQLPPEQWRAKLRDLENLPQRKSLADIAQWGQRALALAWIQDMHRLRVPETGGPPAEMMRLYLCLRLIRPWYPWEETLRLVNRRYDEVVKVLRDPAQVRQAEALRPLLEAPAPSPRAALAFHTVAATAEQLQIGTFREVHELVRMGMSVSSLYNVAMVLDKIQQLGSLAKLAIVLHIYRLENGQYPERLQDLVPKYLPRLPEDLFSGQPPIYRRAEKGFVLYSVGPNGKDDGGRTAEDRPQGDDIRVQIPVPEPPGDTTGPKLPAQP